MGLKKINKQLYRINQARKDWFDHLKTGLEKRYYHQFQVDTRVFYRKE